MTDLAQLGIALSSTGVNETNAGLDAFAKKADAAGKAADGFETKATGAFKDVAAVSDTAAKTIVTGADRVAAGFKQQIDVTANTRAAYQGISNDAKNLSYQLVDVGQGLLSGQPLFQIFAQQSGQIGQVLATTKGSASGLFKEIGSGIAGVLTPMRLLVGGVVGLGAGAVYLAASWSEAQTKIEQSLIGIGARTGSTAADINNFAKANSSATGLSIAESRDLGVELTKTGNIAVGSLKGVGDAMRGYTILTGKDATEGTKDFANALSGDLVEGLKKLDAPYGSLNAKTLDYLRGLQLQAAGSLDTSAKTQILQTWIDGVAASNKKAEDSVSGLTKAYQLLSNVFSLIKNGPTPGVGPAANPDQLRQQQKTAVDALGPSSDLANLGGPDGLAGVVQMGVQLDELNKKLHDIDASSAKAQLDALSTASDGLVHSIIPQIDQIQKLQEALATLKLAQANGVAAPGSDAATVAIQNQIAALKEAQAQAERYNQRVQVISASWGGVTASTAQSLQSMQDQLAVLQARTESERLAAQWRATYNDLVNNKGLKDEEASLLASKQRELSIAATAANERRAADAAAASSSAIDDGDAATQRASASALQWQQNLFGVGVAAGAAAASINAAMDAEEAAQRAANPNAGTFNPDVMTQSGSFAIPTNTIELADGSSITISSGVQGKGILAGAGVAPQMSTTAASPDKLADKYVANGDYSGAISAVERLGTIGMSTVDSLVQTLNSRTGDTGSQISNLQSELAWLNTLPETIARDQKIVSLQQSIDQLKNATNANTAAQLATLNPLYTQGHSALPQIGYYHAANGLDVTASGPTSGDQVEFHAKVNGGERIRITKPGDGSNDNSSSAPSGASNVVHITNNFGSDSTNNARRNRRQFAQGLGQAAAAMQ